MSYTLLLADESVAMHRFMELTFAGQGIRVVSVADGDQAVERMRSARPDILLAEVGLPRVDGYTLTEHVRRTPLLAGVPVLLLTGALDAIDDSRVHASGAAGIIVKPCETEAVIKRVKDLLGIASPDAESAPRRLVTAAEPPMSTPPAAASSLGPAPGQPVGADAASPRTGSSLPTGSAGEDSLWDELQQQMEAPPAGGTAETPGKRSDEFFGTLEDAFASLDEQLSGSNTGPAPVSRFPAPDTRPGKEAAPASEPPVFEIDEEWFGGALEAHRNRLSATQVSSPPAPPGPALAPASRSASGAPVAPVASVTPVTPDARTAPAAPAIADSFHELLAGEQGSRSAAGSLERVMLSDEVIERIASRVAERLSEGVFVETVTRVVEDVAERLVREEIARIRARVEEQQR